jgi:hypothetical protein
MFGLLLFASSPYACSKGTHELSSDLFVHHKNIVIDALLQNVGVVH